MDIQLLELDKISPYDNNPRLNTNAVESVANSIKRYGFRQPIVIDGKGVIVVGHTRFEASKSLGLSKVPVHIADDLTPEEARAYRLADNRTSELAQWDFSLLASELEGLVDSSIDLSTLGWSDSELERLLPNSIDLPRDADGKEFDVDVAGDVKTVTCPNCQHDFVPD